MPFSSFAVYTGNFRPAARDLKLHSCRFRELNSDTADACRPGFLKSPHVSPAQNRARLQTKIRPIRSSEATAREASDTPRGDNGELHGRNARDFGLILANRGARNCD